MNVLTILRSVEELLYEVISWLLFYPRALWMTVMRPLRTMRYSDSEQRDRPEQQYLETLSPPLFLVLSILLAHGAELAFGLGVEQGTSALGRLVTGNEQALLAFRALLFSLYAVIFAWLALRLTGKRIDRESLRAPFFAQCYLAGATAILISMGSIGLRANSDLTVAAGGLVIAATTVWYIAVEAVWLRRECGRGPVTAGVIALAAYAGASALVFSLGLIVAWR
ncbi:hypothetical protein ACQKKG_11800 [Brevundimonas sp. NPDC003935]|uniref:hypothetical protein n=1 Tax=unclassified Brevundimonas TaxID=2622653 RepID=UPI0036BEDB71